MVHTHRDAHASTWPFIAAIAVLTSGWMGMVGLGLAWRSAVLPAAVCLGLEALAALYTSRRPDPRLASALSSVAQLIGFSAVAACLSYAAAATGRPLQDRILFAWDQALGLDWQACLSAVEARPWLGTLLAVAYQSLKPQLILVVGLLAFTGREPALRRFLLALIIATVVTIIGSHMVPAIGVYAFLGLRLEDFPGFHPAAADLHIAAMQGLRDGSLHELSLGSLEGIITFPSLHAALGVLLASALWSVPWVRWPALILNGLLVAATPLNGSHYFVDVFAGLAIAALSLAAAHAWICRGSVGRLPLPMAHVGGSRVPAQP